MDKKADVLIDVKKNVNKTSTSTPISRDKGSELLGQIVSDINEWADAFQLRGGHVKYILDRSDSNEIRYNITDAKVPIIAVDITSRDKSVYLVLSPIGKSAKDYDMIFRYLVKKKSKLQIYAAVFFNDSVKDAHVEISDKELK